MKSMNAQVKSGIVAKLLLALAVMMSLVFVTPVITQAATAPTISKTTRSILVSDKYDLNIKNKISNSTYTWSTSNKKVAKVDKKGVVTAVSKGTATITCKVKAPKKTYTLTCKVTVLKPANSIRINNKISLMQVGDKYNLNRTLAPYASNDKTTWTSSDTSIAKPNKSGIFTALKAGTVTITATTKSGASDSVTIEVLDENGTVSTQSELESILDSDITTITLQTKAEENFTIPSGDYSDKTLIVDAPNADVTNNGTFAAIEIRAIKPSTWHEQAVGNLLKVLASKANIVMGKNSSASIEVSEEGAVLTITSEGGKIEKITITKAAAIEMYGDSEDSVPITVEAENVKISSSVPLAVECKKKITLELTSDKAVTKSKIHADSEATIPTIITKSTATITVTFGTANISKPVTTQTSANPGETTGGTTGGNTGGNTGGSTFTFDTALNKVTAISISMNGTAHVVDSDLLSMIQLYVTYDTSGLAFWKAIGNSDVSGNKKFTATLSNGKSVVVEGTVGSSTKTVTINGGTYDGKTYQVTMNSSTSVTITSSGNNIVTITKGSDDKSFTITTSFALNDADDVLPSAANITSISITYDGKTYTMSATAVTTLRNILEDSNGVWSNWMNISDGTETTIYGQKIKFSGTGAYKTVTFDNGAKYLVFYSNANTMVITDSSNNTFNLIKSANGVSIKLS